MSHSFLKKAAFIFLSFLILVNSLHLPETVYLQLDPSWNAVLQYSQYNGLSIGDDIAFTFGPLGFLRSAMFIYVGYKSLAWAGFFVALIWSCALTISCLYLTKNSSFPTRALILLLCALLPIYSMDSANYFIMFATGIYLLNDTDFRKTSLSSWITLLIASFTIALTKFTYLPIFIGIYLISALSNIIHEQYKYATFTSTTILLLIAITFPTTNTTAASFYHYIINSIHISSGYNQSMTLVPKISILACGLITLISLIMISFVGLFRLERSNSRLEAFLLVFVTFICWKAGYTRADGHVFTFLNYGLFCICYASWLFKKVNPNFRSILVVFSVLPIVSFLFASNISGKLSSPDHFGDLLASPGQKLVTFVSFHSYVSYLDDKWSAQTKQYSHKLIELVGDDPVDISGYQQGIAIVHHLNYIPNPTIQSYTAYNKETQDIGLKSHLDCPRNILFSLDPIDHRLPTMGDALLQRHVLWNMDFRERVSDHLLFSPRNAINQEILDIDFADYNTSNFNSWIGLENKDYDCVFLNMKFEKTIFGRFLEILYRTGLIYITMELDDGQTIKYRYIPCADEHGVLISPLLEDNDDICELLKLSTDRPTDVHESANSTTDKNENKLNPHIKQVKRIKFTSESFFTTPIGYNNRILYAFKKAPPPS